MSVSTVSQHLEQPARRAWRTELGSGQAAACFAVCDLVTFVSVYCLWVYMLGVHPASGTALSHDWLSSTGDVYPMVALALILECFLVLGRLYTRYGWETREAALVFGCCGLLAISNVAWTYNLAPSIPLNPKNIGLVILFWASVATALTICRMLLRASSIGESILRSACILVSNGTENPAVIKQLRASRAMRPLIVARWRISELSGQSTEQIEQRITALSHRTGIAISRLEVLTLPDANDNAGLGVFLTQLDELDLSYSVVLPFAGMNERCSSLRAMPGTKFVVVDHARRGPQRKRRLLKRAVDVIGASTLLIVTAPVWCAISIALALEKGPVLYAQTRIGLNARRFQCLKFRSMLPDGDAIFETHLAASQDARLEWSEHQKLRHDPRITRTGRILRKTSLDELPQLLNVIVGDMSLVGPRPLVAPEIAGFPGDLAYFESEDFRHYSSIRPGITGLWQVSGRAKLTYEARRRLDRWYTRNWSLGLDASVLFHTLRAIIKGTGS